MRFGRNMAIYAGADLLGRSIGLLLSPITTRLLTPEQFGAGPLLGAVWAIVAGARYGGMDSAYPFFCAQEAGSKKRYQIVVTATVVATISGFMVCGLFSLVALVGPWLEDYAGVNKLELSLFLLALGPAALTGWYVYMLRFMHQALPFARVTLVGRVASVVVALPLLLIVAQEDRLAVMFAVGFGIQLFASGWALWELKRIGFWPYIRNLFLPNLARRMLRYGVVLIPASAVYSISAVADRILVGWFAGPKEVAVIALAISLGSLALMIKTWLALVWDPHLVEWVSTRNSQIYQPKLQTALTGFSVIFFTLACLSAIWSDWLVTLLYPPYYAATIRLIPLLVLSGACSVLSLVATATTLIANTPRFHLPVYTCALFVNVTVGVLTIPTLGALGAVLGTLGAEIFILAAWALLGQVILKNLRLNWAFPVVLGVGSMFFVALYQPGIFFHNGRLLERMLFTVIFMIGALYLLWQRRPKCGWKQILA